MASRAFTKEDIEVLTENILENRATIIQKLYDEHTEIDPALLYSNYRSKLQPPPIEDSSASNESFVDSEPISLDDFESIYNAMDEIDRKLPDLPKSAEFKEPKGLRRYNSRNDVADKTVTTSMTNLTMIRKVLTTTIAPPPLPEPEPPVKLTTEDLIEFNALKLQLKSQLDALKLNHCDEDPFGLVETGRKMSDSFDRLQKFFDEIIPLSQNCPRTEIKLETNEGSTVWTTLDTQWIQSLRKLSEVVSHVKILKKNRDMFKVTSELKQIDLPLSNCLSELLDRF